MGTTGLQRIANIRTGVPAVVKGHRELIPGVCNLVYDFSRRVLYDRFKRTIGQSINDELRRIRVEHIAQLLRETNMPISEITAGCRYTSYRNVARYFKREKGMSFLQYRQKFGTLL